MLTLAGVLSGTMAMAEGDALLIGNSSYDRFQTIFGASRVVAAADPLRDLGFDVTEVRDANENGMMLAFDNFVDGLDGSDRPVVIVLAGVFAHGPAGAYLLPVREAGTDVPPSRILTRAFPLDAALSVLAQYPGRAFLVLGENPEDVDFGPYLEAGPGEFDIPQGVSVVRGPAPDIAAYTLREMTRVGARLDSGTRRFELDVSGYNPAGHVVIGRADAQLAEGDGDGDGGGGRGNGGGVELGGVTIVTDAEAARAADDAAWRLAQQADSAEGYRTYLSGFPDGVRASAAKQRLAAIQGEPFYRERRAEEALQLSRQARREIQRDLNILGFNTRGIDGIFGPGTRSAVKGWQERTGGNGSGYLDNVQIARLDAQARQRTTELEEEARQRQLELERRDRAAWDSAVNRNTEDAYRTYLRDYEDGLYADTARTRLQGFEETRAEQAAAQDREAWQLARSANTAAAYRRYLQDQPRGAFAADARDRIAALERADSEEQDDARAQAQEQALGLNPVAKRLAEARLRQLNLNPGNVDGRFDGKTRGAIRRYQRARNLNVTGYLDQDTVVRLLADGIIGRQ